MLALVCAAHRHLSKKDCILTRPGCLCLPTALVKKMGQSRPLFGYFRYFLDTISIIQIEKSTDGVLGIRTRPHRLVGADETTDGGLLQLVFSYPMKQRV